MNDETSFPDETGHQDHSPEITEPSAGTWPGLLSRMAQAVLSPGELFKALPPSPPWAGALFLTGLAIALLNLAIPVELLEEVMRDQLRSQGQAVPDIPPAMLLAGGVLGAFVMIPIFGALLATFNTIVFTFLLGDEGSFKRHLSIVAHCGGILILGTLIALPLKFLTGDPTAVLSLGTLLPFLPEGFLYNVLVSIDVFAIWAGLAVAAGVATQDKKRTWGSAAVPILGLVVAMGVLGGYFRP